MLHPALVSVVKIGTGPEPVLLVLDVLADHRDGRPGSAAKKAEALFKMVKSLVVVFFQAVRGRGWVSLVRVWVSRCMEVWDR